MQTQETRPLPNIRLCPLKASQGKNCLALVYLWMRCDDATNKRASLARWDDVTKGMTNLAWCGDVTGSMWSCGSRKCSPEGFEDFLFGSRSRSCDQSFAVSLFLSPSVRYIVKCGRSRRLAASSAHLNETI